MSTRADLTLLVLATLLTGCVEASACGTQSFLTVQHPITDADRAALTTTDGAVAPGACTAFCLARDAHEVDGGNDAVDHGDSVDCLIRASVVLCSYARPCP